jgi:phosphate transport system substrate-binding protein
MGLAALAAPAQAVDLTGAGSTFVYPVLSKWADAYRKETGNNVNYQSIGSGGGIKQIEGKTVDFGATDKPLGSAELDKNGLVQFPLVNGGVVPVINMEGIKPGALKLDGPTLANIYLGAVKTWNDPQIAALNPGVTLPAANITVVHRSDGSGTSFIWTNYLSKVSPAWKAKVGADTAVAWPTGVGGKGNEGVSSYVQKLKGAIGYVEYAYAMQSELTYTSLKNSAGNVVEPGPTTFAAAVSGAAWDKADHFHLIVTDAPGKDSWPIAGSTFVLMHKMQDNPERAREALKFFRWAYAHPDMGTELNYVPLTPGVVQLVEKEWTAIKGANGAAVL